VNQNNKLSIEDVYKSYGNKLVLDNIDLKVAAGELCTLVGPSGCGKSTLLRLLLGQEFADAGSIIIDGAPARHPDPHRGIVYQKYSLFPHMTVFDNVMAGSRLSKQAWYLPWKRDKDDEAFAISMLERLRLVDAMRKFPHELSGGMQQRVAIAQALMSKPPLLLMDEPFGALDPDTREQMQIYLMDSPFSSLPTIWTKRVTSARGYWCYHNIIRMTVVKSLQWPGAQKLSAITVWHEKHCQPRKNLARISKPSLNR